MDWMREIVIAHMVKQKIAGLGPVGLWQHGFPELAASHEELAALEASMQATLMPAHKDFLALANGWQAFFQAVDVFGTADLLGGPRYERAGELLDSYQNLQALCGFAKHELMPIAVSMEDIDLFAITRPESHNPGMVFWFAGQVIDRFDSFEEWFLAMVDYNRHEYDRVVNPA